MSDRKQIISRIREADAILIGASNGLSIAEGLHLFADNRAFEELFGDLKRKYGISCILQGMGARWPSEEEKWSFWSRLVHRYCGEYRESRVIPGDVRFEKTYWGKGLFYHYFQRGVPF